MERQVSEVAFNFLFLSLFKGHLSLEVKMAKGEQLSNQRGRYTEVCLTIFCALLSTSIQNACAD